tara:strand:+ start:580 stop:885 length:306 start_codon:yes stop_codon:yes gene_type:complete
MSQITTDADGELSAFWKNEAEVKTRLAEATDNEQLDMWIRTRDMREFLDGFNEALERINTALDAIEFRFIRIEEALSLPPDVYFDRKPNDNFNTRGNNLYE